MNEEEWNSILSDLRNVGDTDRAVTAVTVLNERATPEDVPRLQSLLEDENFFIREAAAWPLCRIAGLSMLTKLLRAYQRGLEQGHDNDGFSAALIELVESDKDAARQALIPLGASSDPNMRENATWLLEFCQS